MSAGTPGGTTTIGTTEERALDPLTGLSTRDELTRLGPGLLARAAWPRRPVALLVLDLDDFKVLNDSAGHHVGDAVLTEVGARLRSVVGAEDLVVRMGGDEFAIVTAPLQHRDAGADLAAAVAATVRRPMEIDEMRFVVGASVGLAVHEVDGQTVEELLRAADQAMYSAKAAGTRQWRASTESRRPPGLNRQLVADIRAGRAAEQLVLHYQPQVAIGSGAVVGFEALSRWDHPEHGLLPPRDFIPLAERSGLMGPLTDAVLKRSLDDLPRLQITAPGTRLSINVTRRHILGSGLAEDLLARVNRHGLAPRDVILEITEPLTRTSSESLVTFDELSRRGFGISIHGFGTARSSLTALWSNPAVREVKVDPTIVTAVAGTDQPGTQETRRNTRLLRALSSAAHGLGIRVVAEGVEDARSFATLHDLGCDVVQGFALSQPVDVASAVRWSRAWYDKQVRPQVRGGAGRQEW